MAPRIEKVNRSQDYQPRQRGCSCCSSLIPSFKSEYKTPNYSENQKKRWYDNKYAGPILFTIAILGAAMLSECTNSRQNPQKSALEQSVSDR